MNSIFEHKRIHFFKKCIFLVIGYLFPFLLGAQPYKDTFLPVEERVKDLLGRMSLEEKIAQLGMNNFDGFKLGMHGYGVCESPIIHITDLAKRSREIKKYAREQTRLGIPVIQSGECLHGVLAYGATIFPQAIAMGSTWNPELIREMADMIAVEASAVGIDQALSPVFDLARDPRFGRMEECYSEDPYLAGEIGCAFVTGMQGNSRETKNRLEFNKVMCTAKHFAGYSVPAAGLNMAPASIGEREMRSLYLLPFEMAVKKGNVYAIMPSYNEVDGIPAHLNKFLLQKVLRDEWNFPGYVFSDYGAIGMLHYFHKTAENFEDAALKALVSGVDIDAPRSDSYKFLISLVNEQKLDTALIDQACSRILTAKFKAGLFEKPYPDPETVQKFVHVPTHIDMARKVAEESIILLKNEGNLLPIDINKIKSLAVIGPNANQVQFGDYSCTRDNNTGVTVLQGIRDLVGNKVNIKYARGCSISGLSKEGFKEAITVAKNSDVVVLVLGGTSVIFSELGWGKGLGKYENEEPFTCGENYDLSDINPVGVQRDLAKVICATGKPVVLVMIHGRSWSISWEKDNIPAILEAWYPGEQGGVAIAEILFGKVNPSGRLPVTVPQSAGHIPVFYNYKPSAKGDFYSPGTPEKPGRNYVFSSPEPLFPFGFGLSYTNFEYLTMKVSHDTFNIHDTVNISVEIKNTGKMEGKEVVQLYVSDKISSVTTPVMSLKRFQKINLKPGESKTVKFSIFPGDLALWNDRMLFVTEPGEFELMIASSVADVKFKKIIKYVNK